MNWRTLALDTGTAALIIASIMFVTDITPAEIAIWVLSVTLRFLRYLAWLFGTAGISVESMIGSLRDANRLAF